MPNFKDADHGDGWGVGHDADSHARQKRSEVDAKARAVDDLRSAKRDGSFYELPAWQREQLEDRAKRKEDSMGATKELLMEIQDGGFCPEPSEEELRAYHADMEQRESIVTLSAQVSALQEQVAKLTEQVHEILNVLHGVDPRGNGPDSRDEEEA